MIRIPVSWAFGGPLPGGSRGRRLHNVGAVTSARAYAPMCRGNVPIRKSINSTHVKRHASARARRAQRVCKPCNVQAISGNKAFTKRHQVMRTTGAEAADPPAASPTCVARARPRPRPLRLLLATAAAPASPYTCSRRHQTHGPTQQRTKFETPFVQSAQVPKYASRSDPKLSETGGRRGRGWAGAAGGYRYRGDNQSRVDNRDRPAPAHRASLVAQVVVTKYVLNSTREPLARGALGNKALERRSTSETSSTGSTLFGVTTRRMYKPAITRSRGKVGEYACRMIRFQCSDLHFIRCRSSLFTRSARTVRARHPPPPGRALRLPDAPSLIPRAHTERNGSSIRRCR
ncbi:hypothetical protein EVAR_51351_1 [Eumeta japonica]|uniref:Uncharacterized protein n=1 Tax=Eumeta variegata TaxID=151549 RepID=A0A4C1Y0R1_EUMVA|nr:hypothetical protein EVAR_51351_1 [Eumeta japonica]